MKFYYFYSVRIMLIVSSHSIGLSRMLLPILQTHYMVRVINMTCCLSSNSLNEYWTMTYLSYICIGVQIPPYQVIWITVQMYPLHDLFCLANVVVLCNRRSNCELVRVIVNQVFTTLPKLVLQFDIKFNLLCISDSEICLSQIG